MLEVDAAVGEEEASINNETNILEATDILRLPGSGTGTSHVAVPSATAAESR